jgi:hypothetical protein
MYGTKYETPRLTAQQAGEALSQIAFGGDGGHVEAAVQYAVDDRANNRGAVQWVPGFLSHDMDGAVKTDDLPVEQHDRNFRPRVAVKEWAPAAWCS